jgi:hypothetical protein
MGTLGAGPFENDDALDFLDDLEDSEPVVRREKVESAMGRVLRAAGYIDAPVMAEAVAAAVVVAGSTSTSASRSSPRSCCTGRCATTTTSGGSSGRRLTPLTR